jgi:hypothetical protein
MQSVFLAVGMEREGKSRCDSCARARAVPSRAASDDNHAVFLEFSGETAEKGKKSSRGLPSDRYVFSVKMQPI